MLVSGCWLLVAGKRNYFVFPELWEWRLATNLETGYWMLDSGYLILDTGFWVLDSDTDCW